jgi:hypothetical protein
MARSLVEASGHRIRDVILSKTTDEFDFNPQIQSIRL